MNRSLQALLFLIILLFSFGISEAFSEKKVKLVLFWGNGCPHCVREERFLRALEKRYPQLEIKSYEVWFNDENARLFSKTAKIYGLERLSVPAVFINYTSITGYDTDETTGREIEEKIRDCILHECQDPLAVEKVPGQQPAGKDRIVNMPGFGELDTSRMSLPLLTIIFAGMDSFNPCAFFVLLLLLSVLVYARSRKRILVIGGIFVFFSGFIYFIFMAAWLNLFLYIGRLKAITGIAGGIALLIALVNIKDFFFFRKGVSLAIPEKAKPGLFERIRNLTKAASMTSMIIGAIVLAIVANTYELLCTVGFPIVFTRILTMQDIPVYKYYVYLIFYNLVYIIPLGVVVLIFAITLGARKLSEWQGQILKLISGLMMLELGLVLLIKPALFNNVLISAGLLAVAVAGSGIIAFLAKKVRET